MREIKFRAWNHEKSRWQPYREWACAEANAEASSVGVYQLVNDEYFTWCQYTGRKDKCGTEIYEGDILHIDHDVNPSNDVVESLEYFFDGEQFGWVNTEERATVIGNIYENPELLEEKK